MNNDKFRQAIVAVMVIATIVVNGLATGLPLNGQTTGEISDSFEVFFVPAGYVFSIWGLIYLGLIAYAVYQALPAQADNQGLRRIGVPFTISSLANMAWIFLWHYEQFPLTLVAMLTLLISLIVIYLRLDIGRAEVSTAERWSVHVPFSIYLGWITVATIANVTSLLDYLNWSGWGISPEVWAVIMLIAGLAIALAMSLTRGDIAYLLVLIWAFIGIAMKHQGTALVAPAAWITSGLVLVVLVAGVFVRSRSLATSAPIG
jgi:hypothetical protein